MIPFLVVLFVVALAALGTLAVIQAQALRKKGDLLDQVRADQERAEYALRGLFTPLAWIAKEVQGEGRLDPRRLRNSVISCFVTVQAGLEYDDETMAEALQSVPDAPRRMPKYPRVPTYLATPEDVAQVPSSPRVPRISADAVPGDQGMDFQGDLQEAHEAAARDALRDALSPETDR